MHVHVGVRWLLLSHVRWRPCKPARSQWARCVQVFLSCITHHTLSHVLSRVLLLLLLSPSPVIITTWQQASPAATR